MMRAVHPVARTAGAAMLLTLLGTSATMFGTSTAVGADTVPQFGVAQQTFNVPATGRIRMVLTLPTGVDPSPTGFVIRIVATDAVRTREAVAAAVAGDLPDEVDEVELLPLAVPRPENDQMIVDIPVEVGDDSAPALRLEEPGVHPVRVELVDDDALTAELVTFVNRVPTADEGDTDSMPIAMAMATTAPVTLGDDVAVTVDDTARAELTALADLMERTAIPVTVRVPPGQLTALDDGSVDDQALADRLRTALSAQEILSAPVLPLDVSLAADADQGGLYTQWLRDGEDALATVVDAPAQRTLAFVDNPLSRSGGLLLRNLGTRMLVLPPAIYDELPGTLGGFTDSTQLVQIQVDGTSTVDADVVDRIIAPMLEQVTDEPELHAIRLVADLLAARAQVEDQGGDVRRHSILLGTPDLSLPSSTGFASFTELLAATPGLDAVSVDELSARTDQLLGPEGPVVVDLPEDVDGDLTPRIDLRNALGLEAISTGSMLPDGDPRTAEWATFIDALPTSAISDDRADGIADDMRTEFDSLRTSVVMPEGFSYRLTGTTGTLRVSLRNDADVPLRVRVRLTSSKLLVQGGDQTVELAPAAFTEVPIEIEARSNGETSATLEVFTPTGDVRLGAPVVVTVNVTTLTGVAYLLTGGALLMVLTWWVRHIRRNRRTRHAAAAAERHPAMRRDDGSGDDPAAAPSDTAVTTVGSERSADADEVQAGTATNDDATRTALSPDATTSTLPPS